MFLRVFLAIALFIIIAVGLGYTKYTQIQTQMALHADFQLPAEAVTMVEAQPQKWESTIRIIGTLAPSQGVMVSTEEPGKIVKLNFDSGTSAKQGDVLVQLDTSVEEAQLASILARMELARTNMARARKLREQNANSQSEVDDASSQLKQAEADAGALKATIQRKTIVSPFNGRTGMRLVNLGQYLAPGASIVPLQALDKLYLNFNIPQQQITLVQLGQKVRFTVDSFAGKVFDATITAVSPEMDNSTRSVPLQATVANGDETLRPGMFAQVELVSNDTFQAITLPASAIGYSSIGTSVFVIGQMKDPKGNSYLGVHQEFVKLGPTRGDQVAILEGIKPGDKIVTSGVFKLRPGSAVTINNSVAPSNSSAPKPTDT
jgi:membrane fusion protein (multidrug efflux system)